MQGTTGRRGRACPVPLVRQPACPKRATTTRPPGRAVAPTRAHGPVETIVRDSHSPPMKQTPKEALRPWRLFHARSVWLGRGRSRRTANAKRRSGFGALYDLTRSHGGLGRQANCRIIDVLLASRRTLTTLPDVVEPRSGATADTVVFAALGVLESTDGVAELLEFYKGDTLE